MPTICTVTFFGATGCALEVHFIMPTSNTCNSVPPTSLLLLKENGNKVGKCHWKWSSHIITPWDVQVSRYAKADRCYCDLFFGLYPWSLCFATTMFRGMALQVHLMTGEEPSLEMLWLQKIFLKPIFFSYLTILHRPHKKVSAPWTNIYTCV
jgi:hypothetical protein